MPVVFPGPTISLNTAHAFAAFFTLSYVGSLYISRNARLSFKKEVKVDLRDGESREKKRDERWRDDPDVIRARLVAASLSTVVSCLTVLVLMRSLVPGYLPFVVVLESTLARLGFTLEFNDQQRFSIVWPCLVAPILYLGPLFGCYLASSLPFQQRWSWRGSAAPIVMTWMGLRNYIMGPITEEIVFRACILSVYHMAGVSHAKMIFLTPFTFGAAHIHHAWETYNRYGRNMSALQHALIGTLFQLTYTSLFGFHCAFLFLRSGSILPSLTSHVFCNIMGLPRFREDVLRYPQWHYIIRTMYWMGIAGYIYTMIHWTQAPDSLYWPVPGLKLGRY
ncbi:putative CAAX prenyl protease 2 [Grifola frondosa]|uniref:intramembrane prenyl-peptidase Rce1 n=1 Tax=Grifola frondosa TaxID=5627 RepID=A0A1C7LLF7_GRIFR|nr:putative CAAX prenyl protease 2 [Grifola frondosa]